MHLKKDHTIFHFIYAFVPIMANNKKTTTEKNTTITETFYDRKGARRILFFE